MFGIFVQALFALLAFALMADAHVVYVQHTVTVTQAQPVIVTVMVPGPAPAEVVADVVSAAPVAPLLNAKRNF